MMYGTCILIALTKTWEKYPQVYLCIYRCVEKVWHTTVALMSYAELCADVELFSISSSAFDNIFVFCKINLPGLNRSIR